MAVHPEGFQIGGCCPNVPGNCVNPGPAGRGLTPEEPPTIIQVNGVSAPDTTGDFRYEGLPTLNLTEFDGSGEANYYGVCTVPVVAPTYDVGGGPVAFQSCIVKVSTCRPENQPVRVQAIVFRDAGCPLFSSWDSPAVDPGEVVLDFELPGIYRLCYGEPIFKTGTILGTASTYSVSLAMPEPPP
jgi:hypothetical protein